MGSARLHRKAGARSDRETWAGSSSNNSSNSLAGGVKHLSKVARSKVDQDSSMRWGTAGRRQPREPTTSRTTACDTHSVETKATTPGIYIYGLHPVPPCAPYEYNKKESPRGRLGELFCPTGSRAAGHLLAPKGGGENNVVCGSGGGGGIPAELFGSFARDIRPRQAEESDRNVVTSRERAARDLQAFFRQTSKRWGGHKCRWRLGEPRSREKEEEHRSLAQSQVSGKKARCRRHHDGGSCSDNAAAAVAVAVAAAAASSQDVERDGMSHCSGDVIAPSQSPDDSNPSLSKLRLCVITAWWTGGIVDAAITRTTGGPPNATYPRERRRVLLSSPENGLLANVRVVAREFMTNVTETCLLYAVLARDLRLMTATAKLETTVSSSSSSSSRSSAVITSAETNNHDCARKPDTGYNSTTWAERPNFVQATPLPNRMPDNKASSADSSPVHGVAHIFFPTPPCSTSLAPLDNADNRSCTGTGMPSLLHLGGNSSSALFSRLDGRGTEEVDDRPTLAAASVLDGGNPTNGTDDGSAGGILKRGVSDNTTRGYSRKSDMNGAFASIDASIDNRTRGIPKYKSTTVPVHSYGTVKSTVHSCGTAGQAKNHESETCVRGGSSRRAHTAVEVGLAGVGTTRPAEMMPPRSSATAGVTRKGGGFLFRKRWRSPRVDCTGGGGGGGGGGGSTDGGEAESSMVSLLSASAIGHGGSVETLSTSSTTPPPRGKPAVDTSGVVVDLGTAGGATIDRNPVIQVCHRHRHRRCKHHDTGMMHTIYRVAIGGSSGATVGGAVLPSQESVEEPPAVCRYRVPASDQHVPTSGPGRGGVLPAADEGTGAGAGTCRRGGTGGEESAAKESRVRGVEGSVSIRTAVGVEDSCAKLSRRLQPKRPREAKTQLLTKSQREILYRGVVVSQPRYGENQASGSSRGLHTSTAGVRENNHSGDSGQQAARDVTGHDGKSLPATDVAEPPFPQDRPRVGRRP